MCGIYGVLSPARDFGPELRRMGELLAHRGPDGEGLELLPGGALGHRRLSIIDLTPAAAQPLWDLQRQVCIVFNGEIYNYRELAEECRQAGLGFQSASDTEVIVNQYLLHGRGAFDRLNGMFAFCLHDRRSGEYFLVRDPLGIKPLYYADLPAGLFFASELKALLRSGIVPPEVDHAALQAYLQLDFAPAPLCLIRGVRKLREGHVLRWKAGGGREISAYSTLARPDSDEAESPRRRSLADDVGEFSRRLHRAVERQLRADVPLGVFLSGGLDSSIIAQAAAEISSRRISTFSIGFEEPSFDESFYFEKVASAIGSLHHCEILGPRAMLDLLPSLQRVVCEPVADGSVFPTLLLSGFARRQVKVALSGDGADELFAGYPTYRAARYSRQLARLPAAARDSLRKLSNALLPVDYGNFSPDYKIKKFFEGIDRDPVIQNARWLGTFSPESLRFLLTEFDPAAQVELDRMLHEPAAESGAPGGLESLLRMDQRFYLQDQVLVKVDRTSMACGLEVRVPFLDNEVVRFARALPEDRKIRGGAGKALLKRYSVGRLPAEVRRRPKKGFGAPLGKWFRKELKDLVRDTLDSRRIEQDGFFRATFVEKLLEDHWRGRRDNRKEIFNLLTFCLWRDEFRAGTGPASAST